MLSSFRSRVAALVVGFALLFPVAAFVNAAEVCNPDDCPAWCPPCDPAECQGTMTCSTTCDQVGETQCQAVTSEACTVRCDQIDQSSCKTVCEGGKSAQQASVSASESGCCMR